MIYDLQTREMIKTNLCISSKLPFLLTKFRFKYCTISNQHGPSNTLFFNMFLGYTSTTTLRLISRLPDGMAWGRCALGWGIIEKIYPKIPSLPKKNMGIFFRLVFEGTVVWIFWNLKLWKVWKGWDELGNYSFDLEHFARGCSNLTGIEEAFKINEEIRECSAKTSSTSSSAWSYLIICTRFFPCSRIQCFHFTPILTDFHHPHQN